jgi:hypothetical protein
MIHTWLSGLQDERQEWFHAIEIEGGRLADDAEPMEADKERELDGGDGLLLPTESKVSRARAVITKFENLVFSNV